MQRIFPEKSSSQLIWDAFDFKWLILYTKLLVVKMNRTPILSDHKGTIGSKQHLRKSGKKKNMSNQTS